MHAYIQSGWHGILVTYYLYIIFAAATVVSTFLKLQGFEYYKIENSKFCFLEAILSNFKTTHDMIKQR